MKCYTGKTIWFTGLSGSGKSTLSSMLKNVLESRGVPVVLLDGDMVRHGLNRDLGFSVQDRAENIRRAGEVAKILSDAGHTVIAAFITPMESLRKAVRGIFESDRFIEIFLDCSLKICEARDRKGLYKKARKGEIPHFTGISAPFDPPTAPDLVVPTGIQTVEQSLGSILAFVDKKFSDLTPDSPRTLGLSAAHSPKRVLVIGLDCVPPSLVFDEAGKDLSNIRALMDHGTWGPLRSTDPPITVPAWTTITTGRDPGELGLYGLRNRLDHEYSEMVVTNSSYVKVPRLWDYLQRAGKASILLGIPQTYPPKPHKGITVAGFLTPGIESDYTYPSEVAKELQHTAGGDYLPDVKDFRTDDKERLLSDLYTMVERRFRVARDFLIHKPWDFFMLVEIAPDRLHHGFWRYGRPDHPRFEPGNQYENVLRDFYRFLDNQIGSLLGLMEDETTVLIMSDHGARNMLGGVCINEWLIRNGFLVLNRHLEHVTTLTLDMIDWSRTQAWSEGGYYARIFLNVKGREPEGVIDATDYEAFRDNLAERLRTLDDGNGNVISNKVLKPEEIYRRCHNVPPDLMVYFDNLNRRSIGTVGGKDILLTAVDYDLDHANHDPEGIFIGARMADLRRGEVLGKRIENASCLDMTPTILHEFGLPLPEGVGGKIISIDEAGYSGIATGPRSPADNDKSAADVSSSPKGYTSEEEEIVKKRLRDLGYI
jgi:adenylyl-sulfate kinase